MITYPAADAKTAVEDMTFIVIRHACRSYRFGTKFISLLKYIIASSGAQNVFKKNYC
jgi:hypothetical protein